MRIARLFGVFLTVITTGLLLAPPAGAQPPFRLPGYVTDNAGLLSDSGRATVAAAVGKLYTDRHIRLWVVYVDNFSGLTAVNWAKRTMSTSDLGDNDALLAVSSTGRAYAFLVPSTVRNVSQSQVDDLRRSQIEPALRTRLHRQDSAAGRFGRHRHRRRALAGHHAPPRPTTPRRRSGRRSAG